MKESPVKLERSEFPIIVVRAQPHRDKEALEAPLPLSVECIVTFFAKHDHFALLQLKQSDESYAYTFELTAFATFTIDKVAAADIFGADYNPAKVAEMAAQTLFISAKEVLQSVTSRCPHGPANVPAMLMEIADINIDFEQGKRDQVLKAVFMFNDEQLAQLNAALDKRRNPLLPKAEEPSIKNPPKAKRPTRSKAK